MILSSSPRGFKLIEMMFTVALISVLGLLIYSILSASIVLGGKNTAMNTAHQQARVAILQMMQDIHTAISQPQLTGVSGNQASGISFQQWGTVSVAGKGRIDNGGPHKIIADANIGDTTIAIKVTAGPGISQNQSKPQVGQRIIIPTHQIEADITAVGGSANFYFMTLGNIWGPNLSAEEAAAAGLTYPVTYPVNALPIDVKGTGSTAGDVVCYVTDRCSYTIANNTLTWTVGTTTGRVMANGVTNSQGVIDPASTPTPFSIDTSAAGTLYYRFDLSAADFQSSNRGYRSTSILLTGEVPPKARITTYQ
jgi:prepilin-type N-terminal cleavage/methylation domain-containing protein